MIAHKKYLRGDQAFKVPAHLNFGQYMIECLRKFDKNTKALINGETGEEMTYCEFLQTVADVSVSLCKMGIGKDSIVAVCGERNNNFVATTLAVICSGATYTPIDATTGSAVVRHNFEITRPNYVICSKLFWDSYKDILKSFAFIKHYIRFDDVPEEATAFQGFLNKNVEVNDFEAAEVNGASDVAMILYSSGTTGLPKGVMLTHLNLLLSCNPSNFCDGSVKVLCNTGQWYHNYDSMGAFVSLSTGRTLVYTSEIANDVSLMKVIEKYAVEMILGVPIVIVALAKSKLLDNFNLTSLKMIYCRSTFVHAKNIVDLKKRLLSLNDGAALLLPIFFRLPHIKDIIQGYGMTEAGEPSSESRAHKGSKLGSVGTASPGTIIKIVDVNTREPLGPRETGEICVKGPVLMKGYVGVPSEQYLDEEGFLKTGDLGYYDEDHYLYILDRMKDVMKYQGFQVSPAELEAVLLGHEAVQDVGVVGRHDPECDQLPVALVVKQPGAAVTEQGLIDFVASQVSPYMQLRGGLKFVSALPRSLRGKLLRRELKNMLKQIDLNNQMFN